MAEPFHTICVNWDFDEQTKCLYFNNIITGTGQDIFVSLSENSKPFFEIKAIENTNVYIKEAWEKSPIFLEQIDTPFLYIRNVGCSLLNINASNSGNSGVFLLQNNIGFCNFSGILSNYILEPNENLIVGINSSQNGTEYYSEGYYPFGFFYNFSGIKDLNKNSDFPACNFTYSDAVNIFAPSYSYDIFPSSGKMLDESLLGSTVHAKGVNLGSIKDNSPYQDNFSYCFGSKKSLIVKDVCSLSISGRSDYTGETNFLYANSNDLYSIPSGDYTVELFVKINSILVDPDYNSFISLNTDSEYPNNLILGVDPYGYLTSFEGACLTGGYLETGVWHHIALTRRNNSKYLWLNGALQDSKFSQTSGICCPSLWIGTSFRGGQSCESFNYRPFNGCVSNIRIVTGEALYASQFLPPNSSLTYSGFDTFQQVTNGVTTNLFFATNPIYDVNQFCTCGFLNIVEGYPFGENCIYFSGYSSYLQVENPNLDIFSLTGSCFTIEAFFNINVDGGTILSYGGGETGSGFNGDLYNLFIKNNCLIFNWRNLCCTGSNGLNSIYSNLENGFPWNNGGAWNYTAISASGNCINLWINGISKCSKSLDCYDFSGLNCTGYLYIGGSHSNDLFLEGSISNLRFVNNNSVLDPTNDYISNLLFSKHEDYWTCVSGTSLLLNFKKFNEENNLIKSFNLEKIVDNCVLLQLSTNFNQSSICDGLNREYKFGKNLFNSKINLNCLTILSNELNGIFYPENLTGVIFCAPLTQDCCISLRYNFSLNNEKLLNYKYTYYGCTYDSNQIIKNNYCSLRGLETGCVYSFSSIAGDDFCLKINLNENFSLVDVANKNLIRSNMYLPPKEIFNYDYCFLMADLNFTGKTGISGNWSTGTNICYGSDFINFSKIDFSGGACYQANASCLYFLDVDFSEGRFNTCSIQKKTGSLNSEAFISFASNIEESFFYSGIEFKYYPIVCISYLNNFYEIPNCCINLTLGISGKQKSFDFPVRALSLDKIKLINEYEVFSFLQNAQLNLIYSGLEFNCEYSYLNCFCNVFPKIRTQDLSGYESPDAYLNLNSNFCLQNNLTFIIDPFSNIQNDKTYGLNNFLFFLTSELNSGLVYCNSYSDLYYGNSYYNMYMMELQNEFFEKQFKIPTGSGNFIFSEKISFSDINFNSPIPYKNISGDGYNFILPISTGLNYFDCSNSLSGLICNSFNFGGLINFLNTGLDYCGGSTGYCGEPLQDSSLTILNKYMSINFNSKNISETLSGRKICINNLHTFSGIQPICLYSNYPFLDIKSPLFTQDLTIYNSNNEICSGVFYYLYDIADFKECNLKFLSPEMTLVECVTWSDYSNPENNLCFLENSPDKGQIVNNASLIKFKSKQLVGNNFYNYTDNNFSCICFKVIGDL